METAKKEAFRADLDLIGDVSRRKSVIRDPIGGSVDSGLVYDVGLHRGEDSEFYLMKGFRVLGIEALPRLAQLARDRLQDYVDSGQLVILNRAIAENEGSFTFYENPGNSVWGTLYPKWTQRNERLGEKSAEITVTGIPFASVLREHGIPHYLKVDIEGADILCLEGLRAFESKPDYVSIESNMTSMRGARKEIALLRELGYTRFKLVQQQDVADYKCPFPAKEGNYVDHHFEQGCSGLFGDELPGSWVDYKHALNSLYLIVVLNRTLGPDGILSRFEKGRRVLGKIRSSIGWYDLHAARA
jgi:FkbM family methyltransferase